MIVSSALTPVIDGFQANAIPAAISVSVVGVAIHVPFLDRAERTRKQILTGGTAPPWYGPA